MKSKDRMIRAIRSRKNLESPVINLKKLLASGGMEHYLDLCSDRLADKLMIDGEDTKMNFADFPDMEPYSHIRHLEKSNGDICANAREGKI